MLSLNLAKFSLESNELNMTKSLPISSRKNEKLFSSPHKILSIKKRNGKPLRFQYLSRPTPPILMIMSSVTDDASSEELQPELMPKHIAIILDGHERWAKKRGMQVQDGHKTASGAMRTLISNCCEFGIKVLTVFAFSTENWKRSEVEVDFIMGAIESFLRIDVMELIKRYNLGFSIIGNKRRLPKSLESAISLAEKASRGNKGMHLVVGVDYGSRQEIAEACKKVAVKVKDGVLRAEDIDESMLDQEMMTNFLDFPNPDLLIRTGGELRISNFLLWQLAYGEFYFSTKMFPEFGKIDLIEAITSYQQRERRYGQRPK